MRATGKIDIRHPVKYDPFDFLRIERSPSKYIIESREEYDYSVTIPMVEIVGRFTPDFCLGMTPEQMTEAPELPEQQGYVDLYPALIERLEKDGETEPEVLEKLRQFMENPASSDRSFDIIELEVKPVNLSAREGIRGRESNSVIFSDNSRGELDE
jgi:hypothetical protein